MARSPLIVPGADASGLVAPMSRGVKGLMVIRFNRVIQLKVVKGKGRLRGKEVPAWAAKRPGLQRKGGCLTNHCPSNRDNVAALPDHAHDGARDDVVDKGAEKGLGGEVGVVGLGQASLDVLDLEGPELVAPLFKATNDLTNETTLIPFDHAWQEKRG